MTRLLTGVAWVAAVLLAAFIGWRSVATRVADHLAAADPRAALAWDAQDPAALAALARAQLASGQPAEAARTARHLLQVAPLQAEAFGILASAARAERQGVEALALDRIAVRRAPRDQAVRGQVIAADLRDGRFAGAFANIDVLLHSAPWQRDAVVPLLGELAADRTFALALARHLARRPEWRGAMLDELLARGDPASVDAVFGTLAAAHALSQPDLARWLAWLGARGRWSEAYGIWAGHLQLQPGAHLPWVYNGSFGAAPSGSPFDWQMVGEPGTVVQRVRVTTGFAAQVSFLGRRAGNIGFGETLLLPPGSYRLAFRTRSESLRSDRGLEWTVDCLGSAGRIATSARLNGTSEWATERVEFSVPAAGCDAQRLALTNPGADGAGKLVSGDLWATNFTIDPVPGS